MSILVKKKNKNKCKLNWFNVKFVSVWMQHEIDMAIFSTIFHSFASKLCVIENSNWMLKNAFINRVTAAISFNLYEIGIVVFIAILISINCKTKYLLVSTLLAIWCLLFAIELLSLSWLFSQRRAFDDFSHVLTLHTWQTCALLVQYFAVAFIANYLMWFWLAISLYV